MAYKRKGQLTTYEGWEKHLKKFSKKLFWKRERLAKNEMIKEEIKQKD